MTARMIVRIVLACFVVALLWRVDVLSRNVKAEQTAHTRTRTELVQALDNGRRWRLVADEHFLAVEAQQGVATACLEREAQARTDAEARKAILGPLKPRPRTETEQQQVVDDETRLRAVTRLNRGL